MYAIVRRITLPPDLSENDARDLDHFRRVHESRPGFIGTLEIEEDGGRRLLVNLWESREAAEAGRRTVAPLAAAHVVPGGRGGGGGGRGGAPPAGGGGGPRLDLSPVDAGSITHLARTAVPAGGSP